MTCNHLVGGEIDLVKVTYVTFKDSSKCSFTFSSTEQLASEMESEYEKVLSTFN